MKKLEADTPIYLIIGNGRLARHLSYYFDYLAISYVSWCRSSKVEYLDLIQYAEKSTRILLAISDKAIESFILSYPEIPKEKWIHLSGALSIPGIYSAHPLGSFGEELNPPEWYTEIYFMVEKQEGLQSIEAIDFTTLLPGLPNSSANIMSKDKAYYHSLCVLSNNFTTILFQKLFSGLQQDLNIPKAAAYPYLKQTVFNLQKTNTPLTGPLVRNDKQTINKNIEALKERQDDFAQLYEAFVNIYEKTKGKTHECS